VPLARAITKSITRDSYGGNFPTSRTLKHQQMYNVNSITVQLSEFQKGYIHEKGFAICFKVRVAALLIGHDASDSTAPTVSCSCTA
jgi:hypothetical protein